MRLQEYSYQQDVMKFMNDSFSFKESIKQIVEIFKQLFPKNRTEIIIFTALLSFFSIFSFLFLFNTSIIDRDSLIYDIYCGFDNIFIFKRGFAAIHAHPILALYMKPFLLIGDVLIDLFGYKAKGVFFVLLSSSIISLGILYVYRYLKEIIQIPSRSLLIIIFFYASFSTNMVLAFTIESFTVSLFLLSFFCYIYSLHIHENKKISTLTNIAFVFALGGVTITNSVKVLIPSVFSYKNVKRFFVNAIVTITPFLLFLLFLEYRYDMLRNLIRKTESFTQTNMYPGETYEKIIDLFLGAPMLLPHLYKHLWDYQEIGSVLVGYYSHGWQYAIVGTVVLIVGLALFKNYKNKLVQMLVLLFSVDIFIHAICKYGLGEAFIYGGHWVFTVPLFIGWLYSQISEQYQKILMVVILFLGSIFLINNIVRLIELYNLTKDLYPPVQ